MTLVRRSRSPAPNAQRPTADARGSMLDARLPTLTTAPSVVASRSLAPGVDSRCSRFLHYSRRSRRSHRGSQSFHAVRFPSLLPFSQPCSCSSLLSLSSRLLASRCRRVVLSSYRVALLAARLLSPLSLLSSLSLRCRRVLVVYCWPHFHLFARFHTQQQTVIFPRLIFSRLPGCRRGRGLPTGCL